MATKITKPAKVKKPKVYTYHVSSSFTHVESGTKHVMASQLYQIGVYVILDNNSAQQFGCKPSNMVKAEKQLNADLALGLISDVTFGREIKVSEIDGFYVEV